MSEKNEKKYVSDNAQLMAEWNWERNTDFNPSQLTLGSHKKVWWICFNGHEWESTISNRTIGRGCPYCSGKKVLVGYNDLKSRNPVLANEWNYKKNNGLIPSDFMSNSGKKVWWKCFKGHEWQATIAHRNNGNECPYCFSKKVLKGDNDLKTVNPTLAKEWNYEKNGNLKPEDFTPNSNKKVWWKCFKGHEWQSTINHRNNKRGCPICNSERSTSFPEYVIIYYLNKYGFDVIHSYNKLGYELDIYIPSKKVAIEYDGYFWHKNKVKKDLEKNKKCDDNGIKLYRIRESLPSLNDTSIDYIIEANQKDLPQTIEKILYELIESKVNIDIDIEKDYIAIENLREYTEKENSLCFSNPNIAKEWNYKKNGTLRPENFTSNSNKKVWWICCEGHEWQATISHRNTGTECPYCSGRYPIKNENDLQTVNPILANEWNYEKNTDIKPENFTANSGQKVWWKCIKGHEWQATINSRNNGRGCPYCSGRYAIKMQNDLQTVNPDLAKQWNYEKNTDIKPENFTANSGQKVWWKCIKGHEWQATINSRNNGRGCPYCSNKKILPGYNDLQTINPKLTKEWNHKKNHGLLPSNFIPNSEEKVWWICSKNHEWQATIAHRNNGSGCPYCAGKKVLLGYNDLTTINPKLVKEWNYEKNADIKPENFTANSGQKVWWKCSKGHEWQAIIAGRNRGSGCPVCYKERKNKGE